MACQDNGYMARWTLWLSVLDMLRPGSQRDNGRSGRPIYTRLANRSGSPAEGRALAPDKPQGMEHALDEFEEKEILQRLSEGIAGFRVHMGGLITGSGFAAGPEYYRHLVHEQVTFRASFALPFASIT